ADGRGDQALRTSSPEVTGLNQVWNRDAASACLRARHEEGSNEVAGNDEEDVHAKEATRNLGQGRVISDHGEDGERTKTVYRCDVWQRNPTLHLGQQETPQSRHSRPT